MRRAFEIPADDLRNRGARAWDYVVGLLYRGYIADILGNHWDNGKDAGNNYSDLKLRFFEFWRLGRGEGMLPGIGLENTKVSPCLNSSCMESA